MRATMKVNNSYDVIVVGGGPAGSMAANAAAFKGAKTLLLERDPNIGTPVRCAEGISVRQLERFFPVEERFLSAKVEGIKLYSPDLTSVLVHSAEKGYVLERAVFDRFIAEKAAASGAHLLTRSDVGGLVIENGFVKGVYYTRFGKRYKVYGKVVVAADGVESRVARWAGINTTLKPSDQESTYQMVLSGISYEHEYSHFYFGNEIAPGGYIWIFPKGKNTANVGIGVSVDRCDSATAYNKLNSFIKRMFGKPAVISEMAGGVPVARALKPPIRDGILVAGDAGRYSNPVTGGGIYEAMVSGEHAGNIASEAIEAGDVSSKGLKKYQKLVNDDIVRVQNIGYRLKSGIWKLTDEAFNRTARALHDKPGEKRTARAIFLRGLSTQPGLVLDVIKAFAD